ncbi:helix-turn-helix transcriptional regulator [bacterium]|nr:helix-turn-helix transcriptional regulator [bacterium]
MGNNLTRRILADNVRLLRTKKRFSQEAIAEKANVGQNQISGIENEHSNPSLDTIIKIANALDVKVSDLFME